MKYSREDIKQLYLDFYDNQNFEKFFDAFDLPSQPFHEEINNFLDENPQLACVNAPRSVGKTTNVTQYKQTLKRIAYRQETFIAIFAENEKKAANFMETVKHEIKENKLFAKFYNLSIPTGWKDTKEECRIKTGTGKNDYITLMAFGAGIDPRGLNKLSRRPSLIILDDYEGLKVRESLTERKKINSRFWSEIYPARDPINGKVWIIGTPIHEDALVWKFQQEEMIPSLFYSILKPDGTPLWKEQKSLKEIEFDRKLAESQGATTLAVWYAEYMCDPSPMQMQVLNPQLLKTYEYKEISEKLAQTRRYTIVDLQSGGKEGNDFDVMTTIAVVKCTDKYGTIYKWYILDIKTGRWSEPRKLEILFDIVNTYNPIVGIENVGYQKTFIDAVERYQRVEWEPDGYYLPEHVFHC